MIQWEQGLTHLNCLKRLRFCLNGNPFALSVGKRPSPACINRRCRGKRQTHVSHKTTKLTVFLTTKTGKKGFWKLAPSSLAEKNKKRSDVLASLLLAQKREEQGITNLVANTKVFTRPPIVFGAPRSFCLNRNWIPLSRNLSHWLLCLSAHQHRVFCGFNS